MSRKIILESVLLVFVSALIPLAAAQSQPEVGPGMIDAESPFYGFETAWDNAAVDVGLKKAGKVTLERAAEADKAAENGNPKAVSRAAENMQKVAEKAKTQEDEEDIRKAMNSLEGSMNRLEQKMQNAPNDQAREGMQTALDNMQGALDNIEEAKQNRAASNKSDNLAERQQQNTDEEAPTNDTISENFSTSNSENKP